LQSPAWVTSSGGTNEEMLMAKNRRRAPKYARRIHVAHFRKAAEITPSSPLSGIVVDKTCWFCSGSDPEDIMATLYYLFNQFVLQSSILVRISQFCTCGGN